MTYATIDALRSQLGVTPKQADYASRMLHDLPDGEIVDRTVFLIQKVAGKRVLEFGASGPMHVAIVKAAAYVLGVDREDGPGVVGCDLDEIGEDCGPHQMLPTGRWDGDGYAVESFDVIICGEVVEHLSNPGWFLTRLRRQFPGVPVVITVPNAFGATAHAHAKRGVENVNADHVAWYSPRTVKTLVERAGFTIREFAYYNGDGPTAEGLIAVVE